MRRADPEALARYQAHREMKARVDVRRRVAAVKIRAPSPMQQVREAEAGRITPTTFRNMTRIANDPERSPAVRVRAAALVLKLAYGEPDYADG